MFLWNSELILSLRKSPDGIYTKKIPFKPFYLPSVKPQNSYLTRENDYDSRESLRN